MQLAGRTSIVTGASRGIGKQIALELGRLGANVVVAARTVSPRRQLPNAVGTSRPGSDGHHSGPSLRRLRRSDLLVRPQPTPMADQIGLRPASAANRVTASASAATVTAGPKTGGRAPGGRSTRRKVTACPSSRRHALHDGIECVDGLGVVAEVLAHAAHGAVSARQPASPTWSACAVSAQRAVDPRRD